MAKGQKRSTREKKKPKSDKKVAAVSSTPSAGAIASLKWNKTPAGPRKKSG